MQNIHCIGAIAFSALTKTLAIAILNLGKYKFSENDLNDLKKTRYITLTLRD
jgi:hypothetical protein